MLLATGLYDWLLLLHIVAAMVWVGGGVVLCALVVGVLRSGEADAVARFGATLRYVGPRVLAPGSVAVFGLGIWLVLDSAAWAFGQFWVQLAVGLFVAAAVIGAAHQSRAAIKADRAAEHGEHAEAIRQLTRWAWGYLAIVVLLLVAVWDMTFKPGL